MGDRCFRLIVYACDLHDAVDGVIIRCVVPVPRVGMLMRIEKRHRIVNQSAGDQLRSLGGEITARVVGAFPHVQGVEIFFEIILY